MPSIPDTVAQVAAAGVPVLFLDTCSILDVIRSPLIDRKPKLDRSVGAARELIAMTTGTPPACRLVVGSYVPAEWQKNNPGVSAEVEKRFKRMDDEAEVFHQLCGHLALAPGFGMTQYAGSELVNRLRDLSHQLLQSATVLDQHPDTTSRAVYRVGTAERRPSQKGSEFKDSVIFEECLELCRQLQAVSFAKKLVFCTSNTKDYCAPEAIPHPDIATDCAAVGLQFATDLPWAVSQLKA